MIILNAFWSLTETEAAWLEWTSVVTNLLFIVLLIKRNIWCWLFGFAGSLLAAALWASDEMRLYSEAILYLFYALFAVYGWWNWSRQTGLDKPEIVSAGIGYHIISILIGITGFALLGYVMQENTDAKLPWVDAFTTSFSLIATYLEAKRILQGWYYWIVLNLMSMVVYFIRDAEVMSGLMLVYLVLSVVGLLEWRKNYRTSPIR